MPPLGNNELLCDVRGEEIKNLVPTLCVGTGCLPLCGTNATRSVAVLRSHGDRGNEAIQQTADH